MSNIAVQGGAGGTGTVTLLAPSTSTDRTLTLPDNTGTVVSTASSAVVTPAMLDTQAQYTGFKNRIINGAMVIDQRNAGASVTPAASAYTLDRWEAGMSAASKFSVQRSTTSTTGFTNSLLATSTSAYTVGTSQTFNLTQFIEGFNLADMGFGTANAQTFTLSFQVRSSLTGTFGGAFQNSDRTRSYPFTFTISAANTFETKTVTVVGDTSGTWLTDNGRGLNVIFSLGAGATISGTSGAWATATYYSATGATSVVGTSGATFYITGVQLEKGSTATSFDYRPYGTELQLCQRYFERLPAGPMGMVAIRTNAWYGYIHWQTEKRTNATAVLNGTLNFVGSAGDVNSQTPVGIDQLTTKSCRAYLQTGSYTAQGAFIYINTNLDISAEL